MENLAGRTALITGAASGIGRGLALSLAREGVRLALVDIDAASLRIVAAEIRALGVAAFEAAADLADATAVDSALGVLRSQAGVPDILCANAGVMIRKNVVDTTPEDWQWLYGVNVFGLVNTLRAALPGMIEAGGGRHVAITASIASLRGPSVPGSALYSSSKAAVMSIGEGLRRELPANIGVTLLCPGGVATGLWNGERHRPGRLGSAAPPASAQRKELNLANDQLDPLEVGHLAVEAIRAGRPYVMTHPHQWRDVESWQRGIEQAFRDAER